MTLEEQFFKATHVGFARSTAASLRQQHTKLGAVPKVRCLHDNLSMGPLFNSPDRVSWFTEMFGDHPWREEIEQRNVFWNEVTSIVGECCVWFSRKSSSDYCGYLEWASHPPSIGHQVVDAEMPIGLIGPLSQWLEYFAQAKQADEGQQSVDAQTWGRLTVENAPVRKIENGKVVSAPSDCFDDLLLAKAIPGWKSAALMVGEVLANDFEDIHQTGDLLLVNRLWALVDAGKLDWQGDETSIRSVQMRIGKV